MPEFNQKSGDSREKDFPYFRRLWNTIVVALLAAAFIPLMLIGGGMYYFSGTALKQKTMESLRADVLNHKNAVDLFLTERALDLKQFAGTADPASLALPGTLATVFQSLQASGDKPWFTDLGIIDDQGRHLAYIGPYDLTSKNYKAAPWFKAVMERGEYISDVFPGFRKVPHFVIAVKQRQNGNVWIIRAAIDAAYFDSLVAAVTAKTGGTAFLINGDGIFQTIPGKAAQLMQPSDFKVPQRFDGIRLEEIEAGLTAVCWLDKVPWLCVVRMEPGEIFKMLHRVRNIGLFVFLLSAVIIVFTVLLTTNHLVQRLETKRRSIRFLDHQLRYTSRMASSMQLSTVFFGEILDLLANIDAAAQWSRSLAAKDEMSAENRAALLESLDQIRTETHRGIKSLDRIHSVTQPPTGIIEEIDVNNLLDDLIKLFAREMHFKNIEKIRDFYNQPLPIRSDSSQVSQVFQNLIFNAISALQKGAMIILKTRRRNRSIQVVVVADINLEFFQVRLLLDFLIRGTASNLFACVVDNKIEGLVYLAFKERYFYKALEIRYIATVRGAAADRSVYRPRVLKGVGTFLVAGVWLLWKSEPKGVSDLLLDSEIGARRFYDGIGFRPRGFSGYRLEAPQGHLVKTLLDMANRCSMLNETALEAVKSIIKDQVKTLCRRAAGEKKTAARNRALDAVKMCLSSDARAEFAYLAVGELIRNREKIMDYPNLLRFVREYGSDVTRPMLPKAGRSNPKNI